MNLISAILVAASMLFAGENWGVYFPADNQVPQTNATAEHLAQFDAYFMGNESDMVLYLTFDAGYENGYTEKILDVLKSHEVPAAFFVVGTYIRDEAELVTRMVSDGHIVANHTMSHPDMSGITDKDAFARELHRVEELYLGLTGEEIPKYYRPPRGIYSETNLKHAQEMGYKTMFWSTTYKDWEINNQPSHDEAFSKLMPRTHPGAIILLHNVSKTNSEILDEYISRCKELGYRFESLEHLSAIQTTKPETSG